MVQFHFHFFSTCDAQHITTPIDVYVCYLNFDTLYSVLAVLLLVIQQWQLH